MVVENLLMSNGELRYFTYCELMTAVNDVDFKPEASPFELFEIEPLYTLDWNVIERRKALFQKTLHPDFYPVNSSEYEIASKKLALVNNAYAILKDPIRRAKALFSIADITIPGENGKTINDPKMMEEALSLKESLEVATIDNDFDNLFKTLAKQQKILEDSFNAAFLENNEHNMKETYIRLSFCIKTLADAKALRFENMEN